MDLKFINSEHFFILAACIKECDTEDEYEELEKEDEHTYMLENNQQYSSSDDY